MNMDMVITELKEIVKAKMILENKSSIGICLEEWNLISNLECNHNKISKLYDMPVGVCIGHFTDNARQYKIHKPIVVSLDESAEPLTSYGKQQRMQRILEELLNE